MSFFLIHIDIIFSYLSGSPATSVKSVFFYHADKSALAENFPIRKWIFTRSQLLLWFCLLFVTHQQPLWMFSKMMEKENANMEKMIGTFNIRLWASWTKLFTWELWPMLLSHSLSTFLLEKNSKKLSCPFLT